MTSYSERARAGAADGKAASRQLGNIRAAIHLTRNHDHPEGEVLSRALELIVSTIHFEQSAAQLAVAEVSVP